MDWSSQLLRLIPFIYKPCEFPNRDNILFCSGPWLHWRSCPVKEFCHLFPQGNLPHYIQRLTSISILGMGTFRDHSPPPKFRLLETFPLNMFTSFWKSHPVSSFFCACSHRYPEFWIPNSFVLFRFDFSLKHTLSRVLIVSSACLTRRLRGL